MTFPKQPPMFLYQQTQSHLEKLIFLNLFNRQMSNLMNQARLKVLKARDDMISVSSCISWGHFMYTRKSICGNTTALPSNNGSPMCTCTLRKCWMRPASGLLMSQKTQPGTQLWWTDCSYRSVYPTEVASNVWIELMLIKLWNCVASCSV